MTSSTQGQHSVPYISLYFVSQNISMFCSDNSSVLKTTGQTINPKHKECKKTLSPKLLAS